MNNAIYTIAPGQHRQPCMSAKEIADKFGVTYQAVRGYAQRLGITSKLAHRRRTYGNSTVRNTWYSLPDAKRIMAAMTEEGR